MTPSELRPRPDDARSGPLLVEVDGISKAFGATAALTDVSLQMRRGRTRALLGRNGAGKSTLVSMLTGIGTPDTGTIRIDGKPAPSVGSTADWQFRVACVYQRSTVVPTLTVAENICLGRQPRHNGLISWRTLRRQAQHLLDEWGIPVDPTTHIRDLRVGDRQLVEIARALSTGARFVILDEPTAKLDAHDIAQLFSKMRDLQAAGITFLYISHHLQEIFEVCDDLTVLRDGRVVGEGVVDDLSADDIVAMMTGGSTAPLAERRQPPTAEARPVRLRLDNLSSSRTSEPFRDVSLEVRAGEILGVAGIDGSGKVGVAEVVVGLVKSTGGTVRSGQRQYRNTTVAASIASGISYVPQDRQFAGIVPTMSIAENLTLAGLPTRPRLGLVSPRTNAAAARAAVDQLDIKIGDLREPITSLSGGNQQKVLLARALQTRPHTLVLVAPTAGVDVASKTVLLNAVIEVADQGTAVLMVSDDLDDLRICDRVLVMFAGASWAELAAGFEDDTLIAAMEGLGAQ